MYSLSFKGETITLAALLQILSLFFLIATILITLKWLFRSSRPRKRVPPSPQKLPIIGNLHQLGSIPHQSLKSLADRYGPLMLLHLGSKPLLVVSSADIAAEVLKTHDIAFANRPKVKFAERLVYNLQDMAFSSYGEHWRKVKSICTLQLLSNRRVQSFRTLIEEEVWLMLEKVKDTCPSGSVLNFNDIFSTLSYDIVCRIVLGKKYSGEFRLFFDEALYLLGVFNVGDYVPWLEWINHLNGLEERVRRVAKEFDYYLERIIQEEIHIQKIGGGEGEQSNKHQNFVQVLLQLQRSNDLGFTLDNNCIKGILEDMLVGGTDTTSSTLEWAMTELLIHPHVMTCLQNEVRSIVGNKPSINEEDLAKMHYLKAVIKETLRLHPPGPLLIPHESGQNVRIMDYDITEGTQVIVNIWAIGRDACFWEHGDEFKPERFLDTDFDFKGQNFQYIPFGSGRRSCPGASFALGVAELGLASLVYNFNFALPDGLEPKDVDMAESPGLVVHKREPLRLVATRYRAF